MGEVVRPNFSTTADLSVEQVLRRSLERQFDQVVVLGFDADGELHAFGSSSDLSTALLMFERFKKQFI